MMPGAKKGDKVVGVCTHTVLVPAPPAPPIPTPLPHPFTGTIDGNLSSNVKIQGQDAAVMGSTAKNSPSHIATPPGTSFVAPPMNKATISKGSATVLINNKPAARMGDLAVTCSEIPAPGNVVSTTTKVLIGG